MSRTFQEIAEQISQLKETVERNNRLYLRKMAKESFAFSPFSLKQKKVLTWWCRTSPVKDRDGIIADGAIRSGKTVSMSMSFGLWAMTNFNRQNFIICGKTIGSLRRNVIVTWKSMMHSQGFAIRELRTDNLLIVSKGDVVNFFHLFGGKDERSQDLIQGITAAGILFDEVALMPESFVNQATGRCSVEGRKFWFNCNPDNKLHWFKVNWIDQRDDKNLLYLHFTMDDNYSLSEKIKADYRKLYSGMFFKRFISGEWCTADGLIYDMFDRDVHVTETVARPYTAYYTSCDYGTQNATVFGLWGRCEGVWYKVKEYYYSGRDSKKQKTDSEFADEYAQFIDGLSIKHMIVDPSAASFIAELRKRGVKVIHAKNDVLDGIRTTARLLVTGKIKFNDCCDMTIKEFEGYVWDEKAAQRGKDEPLKANDHAMDETRYFCYTILRNLLEEERKNFSGKGARI